MGHFAVQKKLTEHYKPAIMEKIKILKKIKSTKNVNRLNSPIKRHATAKRIKQTRSNDIMPTETHHSLKDP